MRRRLCVGFYCTGVVTGAVLFTLYCMVFVEDELEKMSKTQSSLIQKRYVTLDMNLPSVSIYKPGHLEMIKIEENTIFYKNTVENDILELPWVHELRQVVEKLNINNSLSPQVNLVIADKKSIELLLNWLIVALVRLPRRLHNVVILGLDIEVCEILKTRNFRCIHSDPRSFMRHEQKEKGRMYRLLSVYTAPQTRLLAARLVNYWGYSLASYDTDALVLKNPQGLFDRYSEMDVVAGAAIHWPEWANSLWGFSMCLGAVMIRSGPATEGLLWREVSRSWGEWGSEQDQFNRALAALVTWNHTSPNITQSEFCNHGDGWEGLSHHKTLSNEKLQILLLPPSHICRGQCCDKERYPASSKDPYIFHGGGANIGRFTDKIGYLREKRVWFLRDDWKSLAQPASEMELNWLKRISTL